MDWGTHIVSFLAGLGAGWALKFVIFDRSSQSKRTSFVSQKGNYIQGDMVAGDANKKNRG